MTADPHPHMPFVDVAASNAEIADEVIDRWTEQLAAGAFIGGEAVESFEEDWARYCGSRFAVAVANGTDALHLILRAHGIGPGHEVILPANTFVATAEAVVLAGAEPRFVDVDPGDLLITPQEVAAGMTSRTSAVIAVHLYGQLTDMESLRDLCSERGVLLLEDAAQAHGAGEPNARAGGLGDAAGFSFYPGKNLGAAGDAGAVTTDDVELTRTIRSMADHGRGPFSKHDHLVVGTNSRLDAIQASLLALKLPLLDGWNATRKALAARYRAGLIGSPAEPLAAVRDSVHHLFVVRVAHRDRIREFLVEEGIQAGIHYPVPCHLTPAFKPFHDGPLPVSERAATEILSLPLFPQMSQDDVDRVCEVLIRATERA